MATMQLVSLPLLVMLIDIRNRSRQIRYQLIKSFFSFSSLSLETWLLMYVFMYSHTNTVTWSDIRLWILVLLRL